MLDKIALARHVTLEHPTDLRDRDVRLVDHQQEVVREVVEQRVRRGTSGTPVDVPGIVLDTRAETDLAHHLDIVGGAHPQPLGLQQLALAFHFSEPVGKLRLDTSNRPFHPFRTGHVMGGREDGHLARVTDDLAGERMQVGQPFDLVTEHLDPDGEFLVDGEHLDGVTTDPERPPGEGDVVAGVLDVDEPTQQPVAVDLLPDPQPDHALDVLLGGAQAVDAAHARHDHHVPAGKQAHRGRVAQPLDLLVDRGVLLYVGVGLGDVRLWLVVVVVRDEVLDGVVRQQLPELVGQLRGEGLVRRHHQRRSLHLFHQPRGGGRLAGTGRAQQDDVLLAGADPAGEVRDRRWLVTGGLEVGDDLKRCGRTHNTAGGAVDTGRTISRGTHVPYNTTDVRQFLTRPARSHPVIRPVQSARFHPVWPAGRCGGLPVGLEQTRPHLVHPGAKVLQAATVVHEDVRDRPAGGVARLVGHPRLRLLPREAPVGQSGQAELPWRLHHDDHVVCAGKTGLDEQRHVVHDHGVRGSVRHTAGRLCTDQRMRDRLQASAGVRVGEHDRAEGRPVKCAVGT